MLPVPSDPVPRSVPLVGVVAVVCGVGLLLELERLSFLMELWGGFGRWLLIAIGAYLSLWGVKQCVTAVKPEWMMSRLPRWNRHRMAATREGIIYITIMSVMFIGSILGRSNMLMLVFAMMIGPWVINGWIAFSMLKNTRARRFIPRRAMAGELVSIEVEVENRKWLLSSWLLVARDQVTHPRERFQAATLFVRIPAKQKRLGHYSVRFCQRGVYSFGPIELTTHFPLGLVERGLLCDEFSQLIVHPRLGRLTSRWRHDLWNATELTERRTTRAGLFDDEFHRIREFRPGDNPRAIHWRTTARSGELMVREYHQSRDQELVLLVELWQPPHPTSSDVDRVELAISFAATVAYDQLRQSRNARLKVVVCGAHVFQFDQSSGCEILLDHLASASAAAAADIRPLIEEAAELRSASTRLVIVSTRSGSDVKRRFGTQPGSANDICLAAEAQTLSPYFVLEDDA